MTPTSQIFYVREQLLMLPKRLFYFCMRSADDGRAIFENPIDQCIFGEFPLAYHWQQHHHISISQIGVGSLLSAKNAGYSGQ